MEKERLLNFIATVMEDSGFTTQLNYPIANQVIDIYGTLETSVGEVGVIVAVKNYEEPWKIGLDVLKDMEVAAKAIKASKIIIFTTSSYTHGAAVYAQKRNIKLVDRKGLIKIAKDYAEKSNIVTDAKVEDEEYYYNGEEDDYIDLNENINTKPASLNPHSSSNNTQTIFSTGRLNRSSSTSYSYQQNLSNQPRRSLKSRVPKISTPNVNVDKAFDFFKNHMIVYLILLVIIASMISYLFNQVTQGPYTGLGKIVTSAIICYGGLSLVNRNVSDILFSGSIIFFISIIISVITLV